MHVFRRFLQIGLAAAWCWSFCAEQRLIFMCTVDGQPDLYTMNLQGESWVRLTHTAQMEKYPKMDSSGNVIFTAKVDGRDELFLKKPGDEALRLTISPQDTEVMEPFFHPDGKSVFYNRISSNLRDAQAKAVIGEIWICDLEGKVHKQVIQHPGLHFNPVCRQGELLVVANDFQTYFDHPLALFSIDLKTLERKRLTGGFEAHGSWVDRDRFLAIHYNGGEQDLATNVYLIPRDGQRSDWKALGDPNWGEDVRLPNIDHSGSLVVLTARLPEHKPETAEPDQPYQGFQVWVVQLKDGSRRALTRPDYAAEGAWIIPVKK